VKKAVEANGGIKNFVMVLLSGENFVEANGGIKNFVMV
jgi:hypothetical protein